MSCIVCKREDSEYYCKIKDIEICLCPEHLENGVEYDSIEFSHIPIQI